MKGTKTFMRGLHIDDKKKLTADIKIEQMPALKDYFLALKQHMGKPAVCIVSQGDKVKKGQLIAVADGDFSANIHSSISGEVKGIVKKQDGKGQTVDYIWIENDYLENSVELELIQENAKEILNRIRQAGIVGLGGAGFPTDLKLKPKEVVDTLIINGAECEPYLNCDYRLMVERTNDLAKGIELIKIALGVDNVYVGIEVNKTKAIELLSKFDAFKVVPLKTKYPQGAEKQLIYACTKRVVKRGKLPSSCRCVVSNIATAYAVYQAVVEGKPLYERVMTISGEAIKTPKNILVKNGTSYSQIIEFCGGLSQDVQKLIVGGPFMGQALINTDGYSTKIDSGLLALNIGEADVNQPMPCINCARCSNSCPMNLMPMYIDFYTLAGKYDQAKKYGALDCYECGVCSAICPSKRQLVQSIKICKQKLREKK